jgi:hypothetical protein
MGEDVDTTKKGTIPVVSSAVQARTRRMAGAAGYRSGSHIVAVCVVRHLSRTDLPCPRAGTASRYGRTPLLTTMTLRQKVAQMVWPFMLGDYTSTDSPCVEQLERLAPSSRSADSACRSAPRSTSRRRPTRCSVLRAFRCCSARTSRQAQVSSSRWLLRAQRDRSRRRDRVSTANGARSSG